MFRGEVLLVSGRVEQVYQLVVPLNSGELLVVDNRAIAHGRRPYESGDPRVMWRKNYVGNLRMQIYLVKL